METGEECHETASTSTFELLTYHIPNHEQHRDKQLQALTND